MSSWQEFSQSSPDLAAYGYQRLLGRVAYLATIRPDGSPRVHPLEAHIALGRLFVYMDPASPKAHDLQRDPRYALHAAVEDVNGGQGEFAIQGQAEFIADPARRADLFAAARVGGSNPQDRYLVFELSISAALSIIYDGDHLVRSRWKP
jgi:hypothetical protein